jgi:hypothetical protein
MMSHSNVRWNIGPLIYIFVGPEMHRWHHVKDPEIRECNYGNNFSVSTGFRHRYVSYDLPGEYGVDEKGFPQNNILKQFTYAFGRPLPFCRSHQNSSGFVKTAARLDCRITLPAAAGTGRIRAPVHPGAGSCAALPWMGQSLWYDEISVTRHYLKNVFHLLDAWAFESNMPVHYTIMFFWDKIFPIPSSRFAFLLLFGLAAIFLYQVAQAIFTRGIALLTCLLLSISRFTSGIPQKPGLRRHDVFSASCVSRLLKLQEPAALSARARRPGFYYFLSLLLGTLSHLYAVPVVFLSGISILHKSAL